MRILIPKIANNGGFLQFSFFVCILAFCVFSSEIEPGKEIKENLLMVHKKMSTFATSPDIASMDLDSANQLFGTVLEKFSSLNVIMRINSTGTIINETSRLKSSKPYRSVASQKWFEQVLKSHNNYYGTNREANGDMSLFWVYPLFSQSKQFAGAISVKINLSDLLKSGTDLSSFSYKLYFKEQLLYQNNWTETDTSILTATQWGLSGDSLFKCISISGRILENQAAVNEEKPLITPPVALDISQLEMGNKKEKKSYGFLLHTIISLCAIAGVVFFIIAKKNRGINQNRSYVNNDTVQTETEKEVMDTVFPDTDIAAADVLEKSDLQESDHLESPGQTSVSENALSSMEDAYTKIKAIIYSDAAKYFKPVAPQEPHFEEGYNMQLLRKKLYREIHGEILHWVVFESNRLTKSLDELIHRVDTLANIQEPELNLIKDEINKIGRNVENFKKAGFGSGKET